VKINRVFVVEVEAFALDGNDHYVDLGVAELQDCVAYASEKDAKGRARRINRQHALSVLRGELSFVVSGGQFGDMIDQYGSNTRDEMLRLAKLLCPGTKFGSNISRDGIRRRLNEQSSSFNKNIDEAQAQWVADTFEFFQIAKVRALELVRSGNKNYEALILDLVRSYFPQVTAAEVYVDEEEGFARVEADIGGPTNAEYFEIVRGDFASKTEALKALYDHVRGTSNKEVKNG
jgi:hypothetical protein